MLTRGQLLALLDVVNAQTPRLAALGVRITQCQPDGPGGRFRVGYDPAGATPTASMLAPFLAYGAGTAFFAAVPPAMTAIGVAG